ncbi:MAG: FAD-dependent oxidoreductase [Kiritimatiellia bacterium]|jgi:formate dehydrogenase major subunit|nr:FAD-dependent oxidoreductase [Kiritimatiellia bacterium]MDP6630338.1 FAD-dependent oxidoreductase [Kiritimatiellia bacterium]MDP6810844.1 FAD-dependent oxidoreductase [Kiritimatiellia bacterium]MDP7024187.1 FAD-dependent oxidoreductase [Kiritimatiellia bacterium]
MAGFDEAWLETLRTEHAQPLAEKKTAPRSLAYPFAALSEHHGSGSAAKDFDWIARNIPCQEACPAHTNIPEYLTAIYSGEYDRAYRLNLESNVFPGVLGRVCARPCEARCRHGWDGLGESVAICHSKRAAADLKGSDPVLLDKWYPDSGKMVAVVGAGVAGLAVARELARCGHAVTVLEKHSVPGGMMNQGIPEFRLPHEVIEREIEQVKLLGVEITCGVEVGKDITLTKLRAANDAVVLAAGTLRPNLLDLPGKELKGIRHGLDFLLEVNAFGSAEIGRHVIVIGGGFTAMDCARTAKRLGAVTLAFGESDAPGAPRGTVLYPPRDHVAVWYRRTHNEMLTTPGELKELGHEHIDMEFLVSPVRYIGENGAVTGVEFVRNELGAPDASGRRRPVPVEGSAFVVEADTVLLATGQFPDGEWIDGDLKADLLDLDRWLRRDADGRTPLKDIFVAGDYAEGASSLINAIGHGKQVARTVDEYLSTEERIRDRVRIVDAGDTGRIREMDAVPLQSMPLCNVEQRDLTAEVETGYDAGLAVDETQRCYRCHYKYEIDSDRCIYCDWCIKAKPRPDCILRVKELKYDDEGRIVDWEEATGTDDTNLIWINQEDCIRCGACLRACPVDAISLQKVDRETVPACGPARRERAHD